MVHLSFLDVCSQKIEIEDNDIDLITTNGLPLPIVGAVSVQCQFGRLRFRHKFLVAEITHQGIIGADILDRFHAVINIPKREVRLNGQHNLKLTVHKEYVREQAVYCSSSVIVPAQSEMIISGHTRKSTHTGMGLTETSTLSTECSSDGVD